MLDTVPKIGLFVFAALLMAGSMVGLRWVYGVLNGKVLEVLQGEQDKKKKKGESGDGK